MALLTGHSDANKVRSTLPTTVPVRNTCTIGGNYYWLEELITTESFSYIGMTEAAATACAAAMITNYTENVTIYTVQDGSVTATVKSECVAAVKPKLTGGRMWQVDVDVNRKVYSLIPFGSES